MLEPKGANIVRRRPDKANAIGRAGLGKFGILRQKAIAGMDQTCARRLGRGDDCLNVEIAFRRGGRPHANNLIRQGYMQRAGISLGVDRD